MRFKTFHGSYWKTAEEEQQRALQQAQDALTALAPEEVVKMRHLLMAWTRVADMTVSEFVGGVLDKRGARPQMDIDAAEAARARSDYFRFMEKQE